MVIKKIENVRKWKNMDINYRNVKMKIIILYIIMIKYIFQKFHQ